MSDQRPPVRPYAIHMADQELALMRATLSDLIPATEELIGECDGDKAVAAAILGFRIQGVLDLDQTAALAAAALVTLIELQPAAAAASAR